VSDRRIAIPSVTLFLCYACHSPTHTFYKEVFIFC